MTREETIKVIGIITTAYPNFDKFRDEKHIRSMVAIWADMFSEDDAGLVALAVKEHISTSKWPPSIAEIREVMTRIAHPDIIPPDEAWEVVSKYLDTEGEYNHGDIYRALPRTIAEAVDSIGYGQLYAMHVAYARGHAAKAGLDRVAFMPGIRRQGRTAAPEGDATRKPPPENRGGQRGLDDGTRSLIEGVNRRYEERQALYRRLAEPRDLLALVGGEDAEAKLLEERERRALEAATKGMITNEQGEGRGHTGYAAGGDCVFGRIAHPARVLLCGP